MIETLLVADGWFCSCVSEEGVFGVKILAKVTICV